MIVTALMVGVLVVAIFGIIRDRLYAQLTAGLMNDLRTDMFSHLQELSIAFYSRNQVGDIVARFSSDLSVVENVTTLALSAAVSPALDVLASTVLLFLLSWKLAADFSIGLARRRHRPANLRAKSRR